MLRGTSMHFRYLRMRCLTISLHLKYVNGITQFRKQTKIMILITRYDWLAKYFNYELKYLHSIPRRDGTKIYSKCCLLMPAFYIYLFILFNDGHVLYLRPEINSFGWVWGPNAIRIQMWRKFPDIHLRVEEKLWKKTSTTKLIRPGRTWAQLVKSSDFTSTPVMANL